MKTTRSQFRRTILEFIDAQPNWVQQHWAWRDVVFTRDGGIRYILDIANPATIKAAEAIGDPYPRGTNVTYVTGRFNPPEELPEKIHVHDSELLDIIKSEGWYQKPPPEGADPQGFWSGTGKWLEDSPQEDWDLPPDDGMEEPLVEGIKMKITKKQLKKLLKEALLKESRMRYAGIYLASDGQWYLDLASSEYGEHDDATTYGPFSSEHSAERHLSNFSNPGGLEINRDGKAPPPSQSPNGLPVESPRRRRRSMWETRSRLKRIIKENHPDYGEYDDDADAWYEERHQADQDYRVHEVPDEVYTRVQNIKDPNRQDHLFDIVDAYEAGDRDFGMDVLLKNLEDAERMDETKIRLKKNIKESLLKEVKMQDIITNPYENVDDYNILANFALADDIAGALAHPDIKHYVDQNEMAWIADEAIGWFEQVGKATDLPAPEGWDSDKAYEFLKDLENAAWKVYEKQADASIAGDPDREFLEFLGNQWSSMIEPNDMEGIKWKEYKKYIRLKPPPSISHGVGEIHITKEDTENLYSGAWEDFKDFLTTRAGGQLSKRKARPKPRMPYYD